MRTSREGRARGVSSFSCTGGTSSSIPLEEARLEAGIGYAEVVSTDGGVGRKCLWIGKGEVGGV